MLLCTQRRSENLGAVLHSCAFQIDQCWQVLIIHFLQLSHVGKHRDQKQRRLGIDIAEMSHRQLHLQCRELPKCPAHNLADRRKWEVRPPLLKVGVVV